MSLLSVIALAVSFLFALAASWALLLPFFESADTVTEVADRRGELLLKRETVLDALEDLEDDHRLGKVSDAEYQESRVELTAQAAQILENLEPVADPEHGATGRMLKRSR